MDNGASKDIDVCDLFVTFCTSAVSKKVPDMSIEFPRWNERSAHLKVRRPSSCVTRRVCAGCASIKPFVTVPIARENVGGARG